MERTLYLIRGLPGAGKSTFAKSLRGEHYEADMYFERSGQYVFDPEKLHAAHLWCQSQARRAMELHFPVVSVANTFTTEKELRPYLDAADEQGYRVFVVIVENRNGTKSVHGVPAETIEKMRERFSIKL